MTADGLVHAEGAYGRPLRRVCPTGAPTGRTWSAHAGRLHVSVDQSADGGAMIRVAGELDMAGAPLLDDALDMVRAWRPWQVRLDLSGVTFCDCAGLNALIAGEQSLGGRLSVVDVSAPVRRLLWIANMEHFVELD